MNNVCVEITQIVKRELSSADSFLTTRDSVTDSGFRFDNRSNKCKQVDKKSKRPREGEGRKDKRGVAAANAEQRAEFSNEERISQESVPESTTDRTSMSNHSTVIARNNDKELTDCPNCSKTNLSVKVKSSKKNKVSRSSKEEEEKPRCRFDKINDDDETSPSAFLELPMEERSRRRLSDSLPFEHCLTSRVRRRSVSFDPLTVFKTAVVQNDADTAKELMASGKVSANTILDGSLPIVLAAKEGCAECLELLIEKGARINVTNKNGLSPLEIAVREGHFECAQCLISAGANTNCIRDGYFDDSIESGDRVAMRNRSRTF